MPHVMFAGVTVTGFWLTTFSNAGMHFCGKSNLTVDMRSTCTDVLHIVCIELLHLMLEADTLTARTSQSRTSGPAISSP